jgi:hypothetical protein
MENKVTAKRPTRAEVTTKLVSEYIKATAASRERHVAGIVANYPPENQKIARQIAEKEFIKITAKHIAERHLLYYGEVMKEWKKQMAQPATVLNP